MKIKENVTLYICEHCKRKMQIKNAMINHEEHCSRNPKNISACSGCIFLKEETADIYYQNFDGESHQTVMAFKCEKLEKRLYPYKVVRKGLLEKYPESFEGQELMPNKCEHYNFNL